MRKQVSKQESKQHSKQPRMPAGEATSGTLHIRHNLAPKSVTERTQERRSSKLRELEDVLLIAVVSAVACL